MKQKMYNTKFMKEKLQHELKPARYTHTLGVEKTAKKLAKFYGADVEKAKVAALLHDCAKGMKLEKQQEEAVRAELAIVNDDQIFQSPNLMHSYVGAYLARREYGVYDPEILSAIRSHTVGNTNMSLLDKIIFLADYIEPGRCFPGVDELRQLAYTDLDQAVLQAMNGTVAHLAQTGQTIHPETIQSRNALIEQMNDAQERVPEIRQLRRA